MLAIDAKGFIVCQVWLNASASDTKGFLAHLETMERAVCDKLGRELVRLSVCQRLNSSLLHCYRCSLFSSG